MSITRYYRIIYFEKKSIITLMKISYINLFNFIYYITDLLQYCSKI